MEQLKKLREQKERLLADMQALADASEGGILSDEAKKKFDALKVQVKTVSESIADQEFLLDEQAATQRSSAATPPPAVAAAQPRNDRMVIPAEARKWSGNLKAFKGPDGAENAYKSGMWFAAAFGNEKARQWCQDHGVVMNAVHQGGVNTTGGWLIPEPLSNAIISLVLEYGAFRREAGNVPMTSDTMIIPRRSGGLTGYFVGEGDASTESTKSWNSVKLTTKDYVITTRVSNQLVADAIISVMDDLASEMARTFAKNEDDCAFIGDGTSTYGGITGLQVRLATVAWTAPSVNTGAGALEWGTAIGHDNITAANMSSLMALLPTYARLGAKWFCSPAFYDAVMSRLAMAQGGATATEMVNGVLQYKYMGYPVVLVESMPVIGTDQKFSCYFGNLKQAAKFGDRQQLSIASSDSATIGGYSVFERNEIALRGTERFDINVHDVGTSSAPGPIVGLMCYDAA